jgi:hypothetical protein
MPVFRYRSGGLTHEAGYDAYIILNYRYCAGVLGVQAIVMLNCCCCAGVLCRYRSGGLTHEAGYDAYMAGVCFIRLAHLVGRSRHAALIPLTFPDLIDAASEYKVLVPPVGTHFCSVVDPDP